MTSKEVYKAIRPFVCNHDYKLENVFVHSWEADIFSVTSSKYSYEIEVKVSKSDYIADFKKPKHDLFRTWKNPESLTYTQAPNRFFYACPIGLIEEHLVPEYAGLIYVFDSGAYRVVKRAPFLHKQEINVAKMLFSKYFYMYQESDFENQKMKYDINNLISALQRPDDFHIPSLIEMIKNKYFND